MFQRKKKKKKNVTNCHLDILEVEEKFYLNFKGFFSFFFFCKVNFKFVYPKLLKVFIFVFEFSHKKNQFKKKKNILILTFDLLLTN